MRIAVIPERYGRVFSPCASIRIAAFFDRLRMTDRAFDVRYLLPEEVEAYRPDVVVWHRVALATAARVEALAEAAGRIGARLVFDLDDNLLDLEGHAEADAYAPQVEAVRRSLDVADEVWCSTPLLARRVGRETPASVHVLPNALDPALWTPAPSPAAHVERPAMLRLLYMGTRTHDADFELLSEAMRLCDADMPGRLELSLVGVRAAPVRSERWLRIVPMPAHIGASYPAFVAWFRSLRSFDLGVAPLLASPFNDCKSPIKVLDYAAIGIPSLVSDVPAYSHSLVAGVHCLRCENTPQAWAMRLMDALRMPESLRTIAANAATLVTPKRFEDATGVRSVRLRALVGMN